MTTITSIGETAGKIWTLLDRSGKMTVSMLEKKVKSPAREVQMAVGWLAREGKIELSEETRRLYVWLAGK
jgi:hypothetical protein